MMMLETNMNTQIENPFLTVAEAATYLRLKKRTLDNMRWMGTGPKFRKHDVKVTSFGKNQWTRSVFAIMLTHNFYWVSMRHPT